MTNASQPSNPLASPAADAATSATEPLVICAQQDGIATLTLNRPQRMNALTVTLLLQLAAHLERLEADDSVRVIVLTGAQGHFSTGADLRDNSLGPNGEI